MRINDPEHVVRQYATEDNLEARRSLYTNAEGPDPREIAFGAVPEIEPRRVLEVGGGPGELAARVGDVQRLPFEDASSDCVVAAWMLFHLADLDAGLAELARVLQPNGRLVATTNSASSDADEPLALPPYALPIRSRAEAAVFVASR